MKNRMFVKTLLAIGLVLVLGALPGCGEKEEAGSKPTTASKKDVIREVKQGYEATKTYTQEQMQAFRVETETKLAEYKKELDLLREKAENLEGDAKAKAEQELAALDQKRHEVFIKLKELSSSSGEAWEHVKSSIDAAMQGFRQLLQENRG